MYFFIDDKQQGEFLHEPAGYPVYEYNVPVFSKSTLKPGKHTLRIDNNGEGSKSLLVLDYIIYRYAHQPVRHYSLGLTETLAAMMTVYRRVPLRTPSSQCPSPQPY
jgi:hypothetical protein